MIEVVFGESRKRDLVRILVECLNKAGTSGTLYVGYPLLTTVEGVEPIDAILVSPSGLVIVQILEDEPRDWYEVEGHHDILVAALSGKLFKNPALLNKRQLGVDISVVGFCLFAPLGIQGGQNLIVVTPDTIESVLSEELTAVPERFLRPLNASIQRVTTIKPRRKRAYVQLHDSRGAKVKQIEAQIANLDRYQKKASIEFPDGPQRIRGLAGSGKTVVLALKAAYLHSLYPDWNIVVTYYTRSLRSQLEDLIRRFTFDQIEDEPDWDRIRVIHSWGSRRTPGVYSEIADALDAPIRDYNYAKTHFGYINAFRGVCGELTGQLQQVPTLYDAILIDEAQDLPAEFFQLAYHAVDEPHRVIWAYDELQNLGGYTMQAPGRLFGVDESGSPLVTLENRPLHADQDIILPVCYRNTPWALVAAHALGCGVYRDGGIFQYFNDYGLWHDVGYEVRSGSLEAGQQVALRRRVDATPEFFGDLLAHDEAVQFHSFESEQEQATWIADQIATDIGDQELLTDDVVVILPDAITFQTKARVIRKALFDRKISTHMPGINTSPDDFFLPNSVAVSSIYRAKGNEVPMVYVADAHFCHGGKMSAGLVTKRNALFTAITRSRGWVRVCGVGQHMEKLAEEYQRVVDANFELKFRVPTEEELAEMSQLYRDETPEERGRRKVNERMLKSIKQRFEEGELDKDEVEQLRAMVQNYPED